MSVVLGYYGLPQVATCAGVLTITCGGSVLAEVPDTFDVLEMYREK